MLDKNDKKIINQLKKDSRQTLKELSDKTKLRPSTIHSRINKLVDENIIEKFTIVTNDKKTNQDFIVFVLINSDSNIPNSFFKNKHIKDVFGVTGGYDLIMKCKFSSIEKFNNFILELRQLDQVKNTLTMVSTIKIKESL
jgi:DNA-binding Lrp family transcriptional regulator